MIIREQLSIRRLLLGVMVAAVFMKVAQWCGLTVGLRHLIGMAGEGQQGWMIGMGWFCFAGLIWLGYSFWFGILLPGSVERYMASRKLRNRRRAEMLEELEEFQNLHEGSRE